MSNLKLRFDAMGTPKDMLPSVALRLKAAQMLLEGKSPVQVANELGISIPTARRYRTLLSEGGLHALERMSVGGRKPSLSPEAREWIATALRGSASAHGYRSGQWTDGRLCSLIEKELGIRFSRVYVRQLIIDLGFADCLKHRSRLHVGPSAQVSTAILTSWVAAALSRSPKAQGIEADNWTNERLRAAIESRFGVRYSRGYIWKMATDLELSHLLRKRVGSVES
jgi:transposase